MAKLDDVKKAEYLEELRLYELIGMDIKQTADKTYKRAMHSLVQVNYNTLTKDYEMALSSFKTALEYADRIDDHRKMASLIAYIQMCESRIKDCIILNPNAPEAEKQAILNERQEQANLLAKANARVTRKKTPILKRIFGKTTKNTDEEDNVTIN